MATRRIGPFEVSALGLGCMNLSHAYGVPPSPGDSARLLLRALELGITLFDTAALYGFGANEELLGSVLSRYRSRFTLASKCGMQGVDGKRVIDGRPATLKATCEASLRRLRTDVIDLYYLHRWDKQVPIEESVGALAELVREGKVRTIGLSEVSTATLRRAHAVHPISALQSEYSLWSRNAELGTLQACRELGIACAAFSPLGRGFLTGALRDVVRLDAKDIRRNMPRFSPENYAANVRLLDEVRVVAGEVGCTMSQLALAWLLQRAEHIVPIPGTTRMEHLEENMGALSVRLTPAQCERVERAVNSRTVVGSRYNTATLAEVDTEEF